MFNKGEFEHDETMHLEKIISECVFHAWGTEYDLSNSLA